MSTAETHTRIQSLPGLRLDGYEPVPEAAAARALRVLGVLGDLPAVANPTPEGTVLLEWMTGDEYRAVECYGMGTALYLVRTAPRRTTTVWEIEEADTTGLAAALRALLAPEKTSATP